MNIVHIMIITIMAITTIISASIAVNITMVMIIHHFINTSISLKPCLSFILSSPPFPSFVFPLFFLSPPEPFAAPFHSIWFVTGGGVACIGITYIVAVLNIPSLSLSLFTSSPSIPTVVALFFFINPSRRMYFVVALFYRPLAPCARSTVVHGILQKRENWQYLKARQLPQYGSNWSRTWRITLLKTRRKHQYYKKLQKSMVLIT